MGFSILVSSSFIWEMADLDIETNTFSRANVFLIITSLNSLVNTFSNLMIGLLNEELN